MFVIKGGTHNGTDYSTMLECVGGFLNETPCATKAKGVTALYAFPGIAHAADNRDVPAVLWFNENMQFVEGELVQAAS